MKFTDGNWLTRPGVNIYPLVEVVDVTTTSNSITVYTSCKPIVHRGNTLDGPLVTTTFSSPMSGVIRVQMYHFKGGLKKTPEFEIQEQKVDVTVTDSPEDVRLTSGDLTVCVKKGSWLVEYLHGTDKLTSAGKKSTAYIKADDHGFMREQLNLSVGENVYGLGERFTPFVKNGQVVDIWNRDGGTNSEQAYKNIPLYITNRGYGVFVNHPEYVSFEVASELVSRVQFSVEGEYLEYFLIDGPTPKDVLAKYTTLTGKPALPPAWSFGLWLTTSFTTDYDERTVNHFVDGMLERQIPLRVFHFDCFWMKEFEWSNFSWDLSQFPEPEAMLHRLKDKGLSVCVWINPYIAQKSPLFDEGMEHGYLVKRPNGDVWQWDLWQAGMGLVDFTNPDARDWFADKLRALIDMGVDAFKTDFGERIPTDVVYFDGSDPQKMHNYYTFLYNQTVFNLLKETRGEREAVLFARSATAGSQQFPVHWGGDCSATYESMAESLRGGLSLSLSGFGFWSHDIGGFEDASSPDLYKRWVAFGLLSSHSRLHGNSSYRVPWLFDEESVDVVRHFVHLKHRLMPYLYKTALDASNTGTPVMRPMVLEFPEDLTCHSLDRQYMLGDSILVAPIFNEQGYATFYLPEGTWTHLLSGEVKVGGKWYNEHYDYQSLGLFVRQNSIVAMGREVGKPDYDFADDVTFHLFEPDTDALLETQVCGLDGNVDSVFRATRTDKVIVVNVTPPEPEDSKTEPSVVKPWSLMLRNVYEVASVENGTWETKEQGIYIAPASAENPVRIHLV